VKPDGTDCAKADAPTFKIALSGPVFANIASGNAAALVNTADTSNPPVFVAGFALPPAFQPLLFRLNQIR
jgi:hypothetical protein